MPPTYDPDRFDPYYRWLAIPAKDQPARPLSTPGIGTVRGGLGGHSRRERPADGSRPHLSTRAIFRVVAEDSQRVGGCQGLSAQRCEESRLRFTVAQECAKEPVHEEDRTPSIHLGFDVSLPSPPAVTQQPHRKKWLSLPIVTRVVIVAMFALAIVAVIVGSSETKKVSVESLPARPPEPNRSGPPAITPKANLIATPGAEVKTGQNNRTPPDAGLENADSIPVGEVRRYPFSGAATAIAVVPGGESFLATGWAGKVVWFHLADGAILFEEQKGEINYGIAVSPDGHRAVWGGRDSIHVLDLRSKVAEFDSGRRQISFHSDLFPGLAPFVL